MLSNLSDVDEEKMGIAFEPTGIIARVWHTASRTRAGYLLNPVSISVYKCVSRSRLGVQLRVGRLQVEATRRRFRGGLGGLRGRSVICNSLL